MEFTSEQQEFIQKKKLSGNKTIDQWLEFFNPLAQYDKKEDAKRRNMNYVKAFWAFLTVFGLYMAMLYLFNGITNKDFVIAIIIIIVSVGLLILTTKYTMESEKKDLPNQMRGFVVPFLKRLQRRAGGRENLNMHLDLSEIDELSRKEAEENSTEKINYLTASIKLPDMGLFELNVNGTGTKRPYYSLYKLVHSLSMNLSFDRESYQLADTQGDFESEEKNGKIILRNEYEEVSESPIESDPGPDLLQLSDHLNAMAGAVKRKQEKVDI